MTMVAKFHWNTCILWLLMGKTGATEKSTNNTVIVEGGIEQKEKYDSF